jgi:hypothetical protein
LVPVLWDNFFLSLVGIPIRGSPDSGDTPRSAKVRVASAVREIRELICAGVAVRRGARKPKFGPTTLPQYPHV